MSNHRIIIDNSILSNEDRELCIKLLDSFDKKGELIPFKDNDMVKVAPETEEVLELLKKYSDLINQKHMENNGFLPTLYTVEAYLSLWQPDTWAELHTDSHEGYEFLQFGTVIYLNDNYEGGEIHFPNQGLLHKPTAGDIALFPCGGTEYEHEVKKVSGNKRYTIAMWHSMREDKKSPQLYPELA